MTVHIYKIYDLNPATYYTHQLKGNLNYPIYQSGRGLGSRLFNIEEVKNALKRGAKCAGKSILKRGTQRLMKGKGCKRKRDASTAVNLMLKSINSAKCRRI